MSGMLAGRHVGRVTPGVPADSTVDSLTGSSAEGLADAAAGDAWIDVFRARGVWDLTPEKIHRWIARNQVFYRHLGDLAAVAGGPAGRALELGCGPGRHAIAMATLGWDVTAIDLDPRIIQQARQNASACAASVTFDVADMDTYLDTVAAPTRIDTVADVVTHGGLMEHFADADAVRTSLAKQLGVAPLVVFDVPTGSKKNLALFERDDIFRQDWLTRTWIEHVLTPFDVVAWEVDEHDDPAMTDDLVVVLRTRR